MRTLLAGLAVALPMTASAASIANETLQQHYSACMEQCQASKTYSCCSYTCSCTVDEISQNWDVDTYRDNSTRMEAKDQKVQETINRLAAYCAKRRHARDYQ